MSLAGIYQIVNINSGNQYIGSAIDLQYRKSVHWSRLRCNRHCNAHLQRAWNKYGKDNFVFNILITCAPSMLIWYEQQFLDQLQPEYNIAKNAVAPMLNRNHTDEAKKKIGAASMGRTHLRGIKRSKETKAKLSKIGTGKPGNNKRFCSLDVYEIRRLHATGKVNQPVLAKMYKTDQGTISKIVNNKRWRHLL